MDRCLALSAALAAAALASAPAAPAAAQASFDCAKARPGVEQTICADRALAQLDRKMAAAYAAALKRLDPATAKLLREDQRETIVLRDESFDREDFDLAGFLAGRVAQLEAIDGTPRRGFAGTWINLGGAVTIEAGPKGLEVSVSASDGAVGRWLCDFAGVGRIAGATLVAEEAPGSNDYEGWKLTIVRDGLALRVTSERPAGFDGAPPFCGAHGAVDGVYIAARNPN